MKMKHEEEIRELLIANAIHLIAHGGFEEATTKELTYSGGGMPGVKMNEAYLYRIFGSKENLYDAVFARLDGELLYAFRQGVDAVGGFETDTKARLRQFFDMAWRFVTGNEERCRCYVRYYYSIYFRGASLKTHNKLFEETVAKIAPIFKDEADVVAILHSVFITLLDFSIRVYNGDLENSDINTPHIFNVLYCMMATYFRESAE